MYKIRFNKTDSIIGDSFGIYLVNAYPDLTVENKDDNQQIIVLSDAVADIIRINMTTCPQDFQNFALNNDLR